MIHVHGTWSSFLPPPSHCLPSDLCFTVFLFLPHSRISTEGRTYLVSSPQSTASSGWSYKAINRGCWVRDAVREKKGLVHDGYDFIISWNPGDSPEGNLEKKGKSLQEGACPEFNPQLSWVGITRNLRGRPKVRRRQWQPTPVLLPGKSHGWRSLVGCSPWGS